MSKQISNKAEYLSMLDSETLERGYIKFNILAQNSNCYPEGVWGWVTPEAKLKYQDDSFMGKIIAILCNDPIFNYRGDIVYGDEVVLQCNGKLRAYLDPEWIKKYLVA